MTKNIDTKKIKLIEEITSIKSEKELDQLVRYIKLSRLNDLHGEAMFKGIRKSISVDELKREQNYKGINRGEFDKLVEELNIEESIEELLSMLD